MRAIVVALAVLGCVGCSRRKNDSPPPPAAAVTAPPATAATVRATHEAALRPETATRDAEDDAAQLAGDRKTVETLIAHGDRLTKARQVDHWIYFPTKEGRDAFVDEIAPLGFSADTHDDGKEPTPHSAHVSRVDHVDLASIHKVVMTLFAAAKRHGGDYDGWECPLETH